MTAAKTMAEVIRAHQPTSGMSVASGVTCQCGYWNGGERAGVNRPPGFQGLQWHQAQELEAAGFGLVVDAKADAWDEAAEASIDALNNHTSGDGTAKLINPYLEAPNDDQ